MDDPDEGDVIWSELEQARDEAQLMETKAEQSGYNLLEDFLGSGSIVFLGRRKLCATRHGCQGATSCDYAYADYPG